MVNIKHNGLCKYFPAEYDHRNDSVERKRSVAASLAESGWEQLSLSEKCFESKIKHKNIHTQVYIRQNLIKRISLNIQLRHKF